MKKLTFSLLAVLGLVGTSFAGHAVVSSGKDYKDYKQAPIPCFKDQEVQLDIFGQYSVGEGPHQVGLFRDHGFGGGVGINYFFLRNLGVGVDAAWLDAQGSRDGGYTAIHNFSGSIIFRLPIETACIAPYAYVGGGFHVDGDQWASAHAGGGLEYRIVPSKMGLFVDTRWTYLGDRYGNDHLNFFSARAGIRLVF